MPHSPDSRRMSYGDMRNVCQPGGARGIPGAGCFYKSSRGYPSPQGIASGKTHPTPGLGRATQCPELLNIRYAVLTCRLHFNGRGRLCVTMSRTRVVRRPHPRPRSTDELRAVAQRRRATGPQSRRRRGWPLRWRQRHRPVRAHQPARWGQAGGGQRVRARRVREMWRRWGRQRRKWPEGLPQAQHRPAARRALSRASDQACILSRHRLQTTRPGLSRTPPHEAHLPAARRRACRSCHFFTWRPFVLEPRRRISRDPCGTRSTFGTGATAFRIGGTRQRPLEPCALPSAKP